MTPASSAYPSVSIVVPVYNGAATIGACLRSLLALEYPADRRELLVVDNGSTDSTGAELRKYAGAIQVLAEPTRGPAAARNAGIASARGAVVAFTDADCEVEPAWLTHLVAPLDDERVGIAAGKNRSKESPNYIERYGELIHDHDRAINEFRPPYAITMNWASRREVLDRVRAFDQALRRCEDVDLAYRVAQAGYRLVYCPDAVVRHANERTLGGLFREGFVHGQYAVQAIKKHRVWLRQLGHRRFTTSSYTALARRAADCAIGRDRERALCDVVFGGGKKVGKMWGSLRFGHFDV